MPPKKRFSFLIRPEEREILQELSKKMDRSAGAVIRTLLRNEGRHLLTPKYEDPVSLPLEIFRGENERR